MGTQSARLTELLYCEEASPEILVTGIKMVAYEHPSRMTETKRFCQNSFPSFRIVAVKMIQFLP